MFVAGVASLSVLGIGWQLGSSALDAQRSLAVSTPTAAGATSSGTGSGSGSTPVPNATKTPSASAPSASPAAPAAPSGTFTGSTVQTQFGNVQVSVTIANGAITEVTPLQLTTRGGRSVAISNQAAPILRSEVLSAQSAHVQNVGGATYTTYGYLTSLQAALDAAHF